MNISFDHSHFKVNKKEQSFISSSLKKFSVSPLSQISQKDLQLAKEIWTAIKKHHSKIFIFSFGGTGSSAKIVNSFFPLKNQNVYLIDSISEEFLTLFSSLTKIELKSCHLIFISKNGQTKELLFYKDFLKKIYLKKNLSLKKKITILTQSENSPLMKWVKKEEGSVVLFKNPLPGRFSFFTLSGLLQSQAYNYNFSVKMTKYSPVTVKALEFLVHQCDKVKEIFFCPFHPQLQEISHWLELSWSESLFKQNAEKQVPVLRNVSLTDLCHGCIEELVAKKDQVCFWALDVKSGQDFNFLHKKRIKKLLTDQDIPYLFMNVSLNNKNFLAELMVDFYKILFCVGDFAKSDIYIQNWVDYFKR